MAFYENVFIARQDIAAPQVEALAAQFTEIITAQGGEVSKTEMWGLRSLTYRVKKNRKGHYVLLNISAPPAAILEMERNMRISEDVLRFLTIRVDELEAGPSAMLQNKGRDERPRRDGDRFDRGGDRGGFRGDREGGDRFERRPPRESRDDSVGGVE